MSKKERIKHLSQQYLINISAGNIFIEKSRNINHKRVPIEIGQLKKLLVAPSSFIYFLLFRNTENSFLSRRNIFKLTSH